MAGAVGIEPTSKVLETSILPLNYALFRWWRGRFELPNPKERIYSPPRLATSLPLQEMVPARGLEPQPTDYKSVALPIELGRRAKWFRTESNCRHMELQSIALPTELLNHNKYIVMAVSTGIEPAISCVTGRRVNRYTTRPIKKILREADLNHRPSGYEPDELPNCSIPR